MSTITLNTIAQSQQVAKTKQYNKDIFATDIEYLTQSDGTADYNAYNEIKSNSELIFVSDDTTPTSQTLTNIAIYDNDIYLLKGSQRLGYQGQVELSFSIQQLTLNGFNFFAHMHQPQEEGVQNNIAQAHNIFLRKHNIDADARELQELAVFNSEYNCSTLNFKTEEKEYWLTFTDQKGLTRITVKDLDIIKQQPAFIKL